MLGSDWMSLLILLFCIILFVSERFTMATTSVLGCVLMVLLGVADFNVVFGQFSSSSVLLLVSMMIIGQALFDTGVAQIIGRILLKAAKGSERYLLILATLSCALVSAFLSNVATLAMYIAIFSNMPKGSVQLKDGSRKIDIRNFMLPLGMASVVGGVCTLVGSAPQLSTQSFLEENGFAAFHFFDFSYVGVGLILLLTAYVTFIGYPLGNKIWGNRPMEEAAEENAEASLEARNPSRGGLMALIFAVTVVLIFWEPVPMAVIAVSGALLSVMTGCIEVKHALKSVHWSSVLKLAGCLGLLRAVSVSGGKDLLGEWFLKILGESVSPWFLLFVAIFITQVLSEFMTNTAALMIVMPVVVSICTSCGFSVHAYAMAITLACSTALCCPLSNTPLTMVTAYGYSFSDFVKYNLLWDLLAELLIFVLIPVFFPLTL